MTWTHKICIKRSPSDPVSDLRDLSSFFARVWERGGWGVGVGGFWSCHNKIYLILLWHPNDPPHWQSIFSDPPQALFPLETFLFHFFLAFENSHVVSKIKKFQSELLMSVNPLTSMSDQDRISPYNINTKPTRWVTRIKKNIKLGIISSSNNKFSALALYKLYGWQ